MLNSADVAGVSLAAIQGLNQKVEAQSVQMQAKDAEIQDLKQSVAELKAMVEKLAGK
jgi:cell division protein FtsB